MSHGIESNGTRDSLPDGVQDKSRHPENQITEQPSPFGSKADETTRLREKLLQNLSFPAMNNGYLSVRPPHPGTCDWVFETEHFQEWRDHSQTAKGNSELWIQGGPGTGKSTVMKHILNYCHQKMHDHLILSHFFHGCGTSSENSLLSMMRSLIYQLLNQEIVLSEQCIKFVKVRRLMENKEDWQWQLGELEELLLLVLQPPLPKPVIVVIDALDKYDDHGTEGMINFLNNLLGLQLGRGIPIKRCLASRHFPRFIRPLHAAIIFSLEDLNSRDIMLYIEERITFSAEIARTWILTKCSGCFLWVVVVVALLNKAHFAGDDDSTILKRLDGTPQDLAGVFKMLLLQNDREIEDITFLSQLVLLSRRSLKPEELCAAIGKIPANNESMERHISNLSHGLVEVRQEGTAIVQFIHHTVQEFMRLKDTWQALDPGSDDNPTRAGHVRLWERCRECMQSFMESPIQKHNMQAPGDRHPFFSYAIENILYHAEMVFSEATEGHASHKQRIRRWLQNYNHWFNWLKRWRSIESEVGLLYVLAMDGFPNLAKVVLIHGADVNAKGGLYGNALQAAVIRGNEEVVKRLLKYGADVNALGGSYGNTLEAALYGGNDKITKLLFEGATSVDGQGRKYINSIQAAAALSGASEDLIDLLLDRGADINAGDGSNGNAVQVAILEGNLSTLKILLQRGANIHAWGGFHGHALQAAAYIGNEEAITILLDCEADVNSEGGRYGSALQAAAAQKFHKVVELLISKGAKINATGGEYGSALCAAAHEGSLVIVESLLNKGADPDIQVDYYGNALQAAAYQGHLDIVKLLLSNRADINAQGGRYGNALCAALAAQNDDIVNYLAWHRARTDLRDSFNRTALHYAVGSGSRSLVRMILRAGASPDDLDDAQKSPLDIAIQSGHAFLIRMLLSRTRNMPLMSARDWRKCLDLKPNSDISFCTSYPSSIAEHDSGLLQDLANECFPITNQKSIPWKKESLIGSMDKAYVYILPTSEFLKHVSPSKFHCRWWKNTPISRERQGDVYQTLWAWSDHSNTVPDDATCRRLKWDEHFIEMGFKASCLKIAEESWSAPQSDVQRAGVEPISTEGFLCIVAPLAPASERQDVPSQANLRAVYLLSTLDTSPVALPSNGSELFQSLISKFKCVVEENCAVANRQLSQSRSQVLQSSGQDPRLLSQLLYDAQVLERIAENHKSLVQDVTILATSLSSLQNDQWRLKIDQSQFTDFTDLAGLQSRIRELEEKSQSIIQLEFNLTSIVEAQRSTSTNKSMKRLSWITFVFLPLVFIASLFGMNVDVLADNPSWWLYLPLSAACMLTTLAVWLCFKRFNTLEDRLEGHFRWLVGGEKQADEEQGLTRSIKIRERTAQYSINGKKRS